MFDASLSGLVSLDSLSASVHDRAKAAVAKTAEAIADEARKEILTGSPSGRVYKRQGTNVQASAPGEPPANVTGALVGSIRVDESALDHLRAAVIAGEAAAALELGTAKMAPRPFLMPAVRKVVGRSE